MERYGDSCLPGRRVTPAHPPAFVRDASAGRRSGHPGRSRAAGARERRPRRSGTRMCPVPASSRPTSDPIRGPDVATAKKTATKPPEARAEAAKAKTGRRPTRRPSTADRVIDGPAAGRRARSARSGTRSRVSATTTAREQLILHYAPLVKYVASRVATGLPVERRAGRPRQLRDVRVDGRARRSSSPAVATSSRPTRSRGSRARSSTSFGRWTGCLVPSGSSSARSRRRYADLEAMLKRQPTEKELAERLGMSLPELHEVDHADLVRLGARARRDGVGRRPIAASRCR